MTRLKREKHLDSTHKGDVRFGTPKEVAEYRAKRLGALQPDTIIEIGAGAGFQTIAFAGVAKVVAVDIDSERLARGQFPDNVTVICGDALSDDVFNKIREHATGTCAVFLDPERPSSSSERTLSEIRPNIQQFLAKYRSLTENIAIELPPFLKDVPDGCEREYLSIDGKLNRLTVYFGKLRLADASVVSLPSKARIEQSGDQSVAPVMTGEPKYALEPDAALSHAKLAPIALAQARHKTAVYAFGKKELYLSPAMIKSPFFKNYRILATGEKETYRALEKEKCAGVIVHGSLDPTEQANHLRKLNRLCHGGTTRLHVFLGEQWLLTRLC